MSVTWNGKEVRNPIARAICVFYAILMVAIVLPIAVVMIAGGLIALTIVLLLSLPVHAILVIAGRRGFVTRGADGDVNYEINAQAFRRADQRA